jgi:hypothetical protein
MKYTQRLLIWSLLFAITGIGAFYSMFSASENVSSAKAYPNLKFSDTSSIKTITIVQSQGKDTIVLDKNAQENSWILNKSYPARNSLMKILLFGMSQIQVKRPLDQQDAKDLQASNQALNKISVFVELESGVQQFTVIPNPNDVNSCFYQNNLSEIQYLIHVPGVQGNLTNLLLMPLADWRKRELFSNPYYSLQQVQIAFFSNPKDNFKILLNQGLLTVENMADADSNKVNKFMSLLPLLSVTEFLDVRNDTVKSLFAKAKPLAKFSLVYSLALKNVEMNILLAQDNKTLLAKANNASEAYVLNSQVWRYALLPRNFFQKK